MDVAWEALVFVFTVAIIKIQKKKFKLREILGWKKILSNGKYLENFRNILEKAML